MKGDLEYLRRSDSLCLNFELYEADVIPDLFGFDETNSFGPDGWKAYFVHLADDLYCWDLLFEVAPPANDLHIEEEPDLQPTRHVHHLELWPYGQGGAPSDCTHRGHLSPDGDAVWRCACGLRLCRGCFEKMASTGAIDILVISDHECNPPSH